MRILIASNVYPPNFLGGAEIIAHHQAKKLQSLGHEVRVLAGEIHPFGEHHEVREDDFEGLPVHRISMLPRDYEPTYINFSDTDIENALYEVLREFRPDVFHGHNLIGLSAALPRIAKKAGATTVVTLHDHWGFCFKNTLLKTATTVCEDYSRCAECLPLIDDGANRGIPIRMRKDFLAIALEDVDAFVSPSQYLADTYIKSGLPADRLHVIPYGIDLDRFRGVQDDRSPADRLRVSFVGALYPHKGVKTLVESLGHLADNAALTVNVVGSGSERERCEQILDRCGRSRWVRFWGQVGHDRIEEVYRETDVFVLPSIWPENQPVSITEAMACGLPAIVSHLGGMPELVENDVTGKVFQAGDPVDLARCIQFFLDDPSRVGKFAHAAKTRIQSFALKDQVQRLVHLYRFVGEREHVAPASRSTRLVVCSGSRLGRDCASIMEQFPVSDGWRFVLDEWLDDELAQAAWLHWIADETVTTEDISKSQIAAPLLVTTGNHSLLRHVGAQNRGLYYFDPVQGANCLKLLVDDPNLHRVLRQPQRTEV